MEAHLTTETSESYTHTMLKDGVLILRNMIHAKTIHALTTEINKIREIVMRKVNQMDRPLTIYSDIVERQPGRLDYRCGFTAEIFAKAAQPIIEVIKQLSPDIDFNHYWGVIPSQSGSGPTDMHRDVWPISNKTEGVNLGALDLILPIYYFTVLIPLVEITKENGPTEFIKGSHLEQIVEESNAQIFSPLLQPGDVVIFDGRTLHRGSPNNSAQEKLLAYITFTATWYHDQTFTVNNYLFPELG